MAGPPAYNPDPKAHPGLHAIALFEGLKGGLALAAATGLALLGPQPLQRTVETMITRFHLDPQHGTLPSILKLLSPQAVHLAVLVVLVYAVMRLIEAWGLWRTRAWASWLGCIGAALYLPLDLYALYHHPGWHTWAVLLINLAVIYVLAYDLRRRRRV